MIDYDKFLKFCKLQIDTYDYYVSTRLMQYVSQGMDLESKLCLSLLCMAYCHDGSGWIAFNSPGVREYENLPPDNLPISYVRRNLFGGRIERHLDELLSIGKDIGFANWLNVNTWSELLTKLLSIYGNGRYSSYSTAEYVINMGINVKPDSYEIAKSTGPKEGLECLGLNTTEESACELQKTLFNDGLIVDPATLESILCNWSRMHKGDFYVGYAIDLQQGRLLRGQGLNTGVSFDELWSARSKWFSKRTLGEINGWVGIDTQRTKVYMRENEVLTPWENR